MQKLLDRDFLAGAVLILIGAISWAKAGNDVMNWAFPLLATYFMLAVGAVLVVRAVFAEVATHVPDILRMSAEDRIVALDVFVISLMALGYLLVLYVLGFWLASFVMLSLASVYLTLDRTPRNIALAVFVAFATCVVAYVIFQHVFYVPVPQASWWG